MLGREIEKEIRKVVEVRDGDAVLNICMSAHVPYDRQKDCDMGFVIDGIASENKKLTHYLASFDYMTLSRKEDENECLAGYPLVFPLRGSKSLRSEVPAVFWMKNGEEEKKYRVYLQPVGLGAKDPFLTVYARFDWMDEKCAGLLLESEQPVRYSHQPLFCRIGNPFNMAYNSAGKMTKYPIDLAPIKDDETGLITAQRNMEVFAMQWKQAVSAF